MFPVFEDPGKLVLICHYWKEMVLQIIRSGVSGEVAKNQARRLMLAQFTGQSSEVR